MTSVKVVQSVQVTSPLPYHSPPTLHNSPSHNNDICISYTHQVCINCTPSGRRYETLREAVNTAQNRWLWRLLATTGTIHSCAASQKWWRCGNMPLSNSKVTHNSASLCNSKVTHNSASLSNSKVTHNSRLIEWRLVGWRLTARSAQKCYIVPCEK